MGVLQVLRAFVVEVELAHSMSVNAQPSLQNLCASRALEQSLKFPVMMSISAVRLPRESLQLLSMCSPLFDGRNTSR